MRANLVWLDIPTLHRVREQTASFSGHRGFWDLLCEVGGRPMTVSKGIHTYPVLHLERNLKDCHRRSCAPNAQSRGVDLRRSRFLDEKKKHMYKRLAFQTRQRRDVNEVYKHVILKNEASTLPFFLTLILA